MLGQAGVHSEWLENEGNKMNGEWKTGEWRKGPNGIMWGPLAAKKKK